MKQQVNLYQYLPHAYKFRLSKKVVGLTYGLLFFLLMLDFFHALWVHHKNIKEMNILEQSFRQQQKMLADIMVQFPMINPSDLQNSLQQLQKQLDLRLKIYATLSQGEGFSQYMSGLGEVIEPSVWLTEINFSNADRRMNLQGYALTSLAIEQYLDQLAKEKIFSGMLFSLQELTLVRVDKTNQYGYLSFHATSRAARLL